MDCTVDDLKDVISNLESLANELYESNSYDIQDQVEDQVYLLKLIVDNIEDIRDKISKLI